MDDQPSENQNNEQSVTTPDLSELEQVKERAVSLLLPVIDSMEGTPEQKFEMLMMAARSSSNAALLNKALDAAQNIPDEREKASALLDVLNEINYGLRN
jgi:hypothetical protein